MSYLNSNNKNLTMSKKSYIFNKGLSLLFVLFLSLFLSHSLFAQNDDSRTAQVVKEEGLTEDQLTFNHSLDASETQINLLETKLNNANIAGLKSVSIDFVTKEVTAIVEKNILERKLRHIFRCVGFNNYIFE